MNIHLILSALESEDIEITEHTEDSITTKHFIEDKEVFIYGKIQDCVSSFRPLLYLCNRASFGLLAHVGWPDECDRGLICSGAQDVVSVNYHCPEKVYVADLRKQFEDIKPALMDIDTNLKECMREYAAHWSKAEPSRVGPTPLVVAEPSQFIEDLFVRTAIPKSFGLSAMVILSSQDYAHLDDRYCVRQNATKSTRQNRGMGCLVHICQLIPPPEPGEEIRDWWRNQIDKLDNADVEALETYARRHKGREFWITLYSEYEEKSIWIAMHAVADTKKHIPLTGNYLEGWTLTARSVVPHVKSIIMPRAGASLNVQDKRVVLVGCGSVGSIIADQLASAGIGNLVLVDRDIFEPTNIYRHTLSMSACGMHKATAIEWQLRSKYPYLQCTSMVKDLMNIGEDVIRSADLVVVAIGSPTDELMFNERLVKSTVHTPVVYCWLEAMGVGGHAVLVDEKYDSGCLQCNYFRKGVGVTLHSTLNYLEPNQPVTRDIGGCGSLYLPYGKLDATQTATIATRLALGKLSGAIARSKRISWMGSDEEAKANKIIFTDRYARSASHMKPEIFHEDDCPICNGKPNH